MTTAPTGREGRKRMKTPKRACRGCFNCTPVYGNFDRQGKRVVSKYWCTAKSRTAPDPKECAEKEEKQ